MEPQDLILNTINDFHKSKITLVEWETPLLTRLGYPLAPKPDFIFLIPDDQIGQANRIASSNCLSDKKHPISYLSEHAKRGTRYVSGEPARRLILLPLSWTGIQKNELTAIPSSSPRTIWTVPLPVFCTAYLRIIIQEGNQSMARTLAIGDLSNVVAYSMFDMDYEGSYMPCPEDDFDEFGQIQQEDKENMEAISQKDALEMQNALKTIKCWKLTKENEWAREMMMDLVSGKREYERLPCKDKPSNAGGAGNNVPRFR